MDMRKRKVAIGTCLALCTAACATDAVPPRSAQLRFSGCSDGERLSISRAFARAARLADGVASAVEDPAILEPLRGDDWTAYRWWFGEFEEERFAAVRRTLHATRSGFGRRVTMLCGAKTLNCPPPRAAPRELPRRSRDRDEYGPELEGRRSVRRAWKEFAYANFGIPAVQLCPDFFAVDRDDRALILLHELTHVSSDTEDYAYSERDALALARERPERATRNAPSYAAFAASVVHKRTPRPLRKALEEDD